MATVVGVWPASEKEKIHHAFTRFQNDGWAQSQTLPLLILRETENDLQGSAKRWAPGCVNAAGKARQK